MLEKNADFLSLSWKITILHWTSNFFQNFNMLTFGSTKLDFFGIVLFNFFFLVMKKSVCFFSACKSLAQTMSSIENPQLSFQCKTLFMFMQETILLSANFCILRKREIMHSYSFHKKSKSSLSKKLINFFY